jgi:hypothetical protein
VGVEDGMGLDTTRFEGGGSHAPIMGGGSQFLASRGSLIVICGW